jgi:hypothetical protein
MRAVLLLAVLLGVTSAKLPHIFMVIVDDFGKKKRKWRDV